MSDTSRTDDTLGVFMNKDGEEKKGLHRKNASVTCNDDDQAVGKISDQLSVKDLLDKEMKLPDRESETLKRNCDFVKTFINEMKTRGNLGLSGESKEIICEFNKVITDYAENVDKSNSKYIFSGAKPKIVKKPKTIAEKSETESDSSEACDSKRYNLTSDSSEDEISEVDRRKSRKVLPKKKTERSDSDENTGILRLLKKLDSRKVPELDKYNESTGQDLVKYLHRFEDYCQETYRGKPYLWVTELERHLSGKTLETFTCLRSFDDDYHDIKKKLISWYRQEEDIRKVRARTKFENARIKNGESMYNFSSRLEQLFKVAYPKLNFKQSNKLIYKYKESVPRQMKEILNSQIMNLKMREKKISWKQIQKCSRIYDLDISMLKIKDDSDSDHSRKEIIINLSKPDKKEMKKLDSNNNIEFNQPPRKYNAVNQINRYQQRFYPEHRGSQGNNNYRFQNISLYNPNANHFSNFERSTFQRQQAPTMNDAKKCTVCYKFGHTYINCRKRLGECFLCGERNHFVRQCPRTINSPNFQLRSRGKSFSPQKNRLRERNWSQQRPVDFERVNLN